MPAVVENWTLAGLAAGVLHVRSVTGDCASEWDLQWDVGTKTAEAGGAVPIDDATHEKCGLVAVWRLFNLSSLSSGLKLENSGTRPHRAREGGSRVGGWSSCF